MRRRAAFIGAVAAAFLPGPAFALGGRRLALARLKEAEHLARLLTTDVLLTGDRGLYEKTRVVHRMIRNARRDLTETRRSC